MSEVQTGTSAATPATDFEPDERWVPADERIFGLDRRTLGPTLTVIALAFVMSVVLPFIDATVPYHDIVTAGDVIELKGGVTFVPEVGWGITAGVRAGHGPLDGEYPDTATVENGDVKLTVRTAPFDGDADKLLDQIQTTSDALSRGRGVRITGQHTTILTEQGKQGALARVTGPQKGGVIAAFVFNGQGVEAEAIGPSEAGTEPTAAVLRMIRSIAYPEAAAP